jgi:hypothetical protein
MRSTRHNNAIWVGLVLSLALHGGVLLPWLHSAMTSRYDEVVTRTSQLRPDDVRDRRADPDEAITLGIDHSEASTMTWIGYEEYVEHVARQSVVEQAEQTIAVGMDPSNPYAPIRRPEPPAEAVSDVASDTRPTEAEPAEPAAQPTEHADAAPEADGFDSNAAIEALRRSVGRVEQWRDVVDDAMLALMTAAMQRASSPDEPNQAMTDSRNESEKADAPETSESSEEAQTTARNTAEDAEHGGGDPDAEHIGDKPGEPGTPADREAVATSVIDVTPDKWQAGQPIAAEGLTIQTRRPRFTALERRALISANPVYEIHFDHRGVPGDVYVKGTSGHQGIDEAILTSVYQWRGQGRAIDALSEGATLKFSVRIILRGP